MKNRIASSAAIAAALALGLTGCGLIAPQATMTPYAPSDGIDVNVEGAKVRNLMLIADETGENFNVVFTGVNSGSSSVPLTINFEGESSQASADFEIEPGSTVFGPLDEEHPPVLVSLGGLEPGATVSAYFQTPGGDEVQREVPVLDGTLAEYRDLVVPASETDGGKVGIDEDETDIAADEASAEDASADESGDASTEEDHSHE